MLTNDLMNKCEKFKDQHDEYRTIRTQMWISMLILFVFGGAWLVVNDESFVNYEFVSELNWVTGIFSLIFLGLTYIIREKARPKKLKLNELAALRTYTVHNVIEDYLNRSKYEPNLDEAKDELSSLGIEITTDWSAFEENNNILSIYLKDISEFMTNMKSVDTIFDKEDVSFEQFQLFLVKMLKFFLGHQDIKIEELNSELKNYIIIDEDVDESETIKGFVSKHPILKFVWIPPVISTIIYFVFIGIDSNDIKTALSVSLIIGTTISVGMAFKRNNFK